jgi:hypothetical integral membrane protein (TIGR02206 family)
MASYFAFDYAGGAFELFGPAHLVTLAVIAALTVWLARAGRAASDEGRRTMRRTIAVALLVNEASWHAWNLAHGAWDPGHMLPLHVCSVMVWLAVAVLWVGYRPFYAPVYFLGVAGALQALITPDAGIYGFPHFRFLQTMIAHGGLVAAGIWVVTAERYSPSARDGVRVLAALNVYALAVYFVNGWIGSNYLYVNAKPDSASIIDAMPGWPWYVPILELLAVAIFVLLLLPFRRRPVTAPSAENVPALERLGRA